MRAKEKRGPEGAAAVFCRREHVLGGCRYGMLRPATDGSAGVKTGGQLKSEKHAPAIADFHVTRSVRGGRLFPGAVSVWETPDFHPR